MEIVFTIWHTTHSSPLLLIPSAQASLHIFNHFSQFWTLALFFFCGFKTVCLHPSGIYHLQKKEISLPEEPQEEESKVRRMQWSFLRIQMLKFFIGQRDSFDNIIVCVCPPSCCYVLCSSHRECVFVMKVLEKPSRPRGPPLKNPRTSPVETLCMWSLHKHTHTVKRKHILVAATGGKIISGVFVQDPLFVFL